MYELDMLISVAGIEWPGVVVLADNPNGQPEIQRARAQVQGEWWELPGEFLTAEDQRRAVNAALARDRD